MDADKPEVHLPSPLWAKCKAPASWGRLVVPAQHRMPWNALKATSFWELAQIQLPQGEARGAQSCWHSTLQVCLSRPTSRWHQELPHPFAPWSSFSWTALPALKRVVKYGYEAGQTPIQAITMTVAVQTRITALTRYFFIYFSCPCGWLQFSGAFLRVVVLGMGFTCVSYWKSMLC